MRTILLLLCALTLTAQPNTLTPQEAAEGWILLFDGESMFGWTPVADAKWKAADGAIVSDGGTYGWLRSNSQFADYILRLEFRTREDGNSGIFLRSATEGQPHVTGYELQIWSKNEKFPTGSLVNHHAAKGAAFKGDVWNSYEVQVTGDHWVVVLNGTKVLDVRDGKSKAGHIGFQFNKDKIEYRNIKLKPLGLQSIFNGKDLTGWRRVDRPNVKEPPVWTVKDGMIHVEKGPGQIETERVWDDFVFQIAIRANAQNANHHPNSGVFFRGDKDVFWSGYESQIRNEYKDGDRNAPVDFGTGGIYRNQATRRVVANDNEFFTKTIVARGRHMAVWINGFPVSDFEDTNPEGADVRKQARLAAGTFSLQAHDPTTNLDFKDIRVAAIPK
jgi:hypothetical protein